VAEVYMVDSAAAEETAAMSQAVEKRADFVSIPATMRALQQTSLKGP
jgi:hypothetical protein